MSLDLAEASQLAIEQSHPPPSAMLQQITSPLCLSVCLPGVAQGAGDPDLPCASLTPGEAHGDTGVCAEDAGVE